MVLVASLLLLVFNTWWYSSAYEVNQELLSEERRYDKELGDYTIREEVEKNDDGLASLQSPKISSFSFLANEILKKANEVKIIELEMFPYKIQRKKISQDNERIFVRGRSSQFDQVNRLIAELKLVEGIVEVQMTNISAIPESSKMEFTLSINTQP